MYENSQSSISHFLKPLYHSGYLLCMFSFLIGGMPFCSELFIAVLILLSKYSDEGSSLLSTLSNVDTKNIFILNALQSLNPSADPQTLTEKSLTTFLKEYYRRGMSTEAIPTRRLIIFDQLEELFSLYSDRLQDQLKDLDKLQRRWMMTRCYVLYLLYAKNTYLNSIILLALSKEDCGRGFVWSTCAKRQPFWLLKDL